MEGLDVVVEINPEVTIDRLKVIAVSNFNDPAESTKLSLYHKLIHVKSGQYLSEDSTVAGEQIKEGGRLLSVQKSNVWQVWAILGFLQAS